MTERPARKRWLRRTAVAALLLWPAAPLPAAEIDFAARWGAWGEIGATYGTEESSYGEIAVFAPLWQDPDSLLFTEIRGKFSRAT